MFHFAVIYLFLLQVCKRLEIQGVLVALPVQLCWKDCVCGEQ